MKEIKEDSLKSVFQENATTVVDFFATWCGPCNVLAPVLDDLSNEIKDVSFVKVDVERCPNLTAQFDISNVPTVIVFQNGKEVQRMIGLQHKTSMRDVIELAISKGRTP